MSEQKDAELQKSINEIDARMYELLMQRTELVKQQSETNVVANSLGREAASIKRLLRAHKGDFPEYVIAKIWREILPASAFLNAKLKISLFGGQEHDGCLVNIVQEHFGSNVECETFSSFGQVMNALTSGEAQLAVIPCDNHDINQKPWWSAFSASSGKHLQIIAKLPFIRRKEVKDPEEVYVISRSAPDKSGCDISLLSVEVENEVSSSTVVELLEEKGFKEVKVLLMVPFDSEGKSCLVEVNGYIQADDSRLSGFEECIKNISVAGAYACPVSL